MDAIDMLKEDHKRIRELIQRMLGTSNEQVDERTQMFELLKQELEIHTRVEEDVFYPVMDRQGGHEHEEVDDALKEHGEIRDLLNVMSRTDPSSNSWEDKLEELHQTLEHHIDDEENDLFVCARDDIPADLENIGNRMYQEKGDLLRAY